MEGLGELPFTESTRRYLTRKLADIGIGMLNNDREWLRTGCVNDWLVMKDKSDSRGMERMELEPGRIGMTHVRFLFNVIVDELILEMWILVKRW